MPISRRRFMIASALRALARPRIGRAATPPARTPAATESSSGGASDIAPRG